MKRWTENEEITLKKIWLKSKKPEILKELNGRTWNSIRRKSKNLGLEKRKEDNEWTDNEISILKKLWTNNSREDVLNAINDKTWQAISMMASNLKIKRDKTDPNVAKNKRKWSQQENSLLKKCWFDHKRKDVLKLFNKRTWDSIIIQSSKLGLERDRCSLNVRPNLRINFKKNISKMSKLLEESPEAYYWIGFIFADGSFNFKQNRLTIGLSVKDERHLEKFCDFVNLNKNSLYHGESRFSKEFKKTKFVRLAIADKSVVSALIEKFNFKEKKTYYPPEDLYIKNNDMFLSFLIGYIDGDGSIGHQSGRRDCALRVKCHSSWKNILQTWFDRLYKLAEVKSLNAMSKLTTEVKINSDGYAEVMSGNSKVLAFLKNKTIELNLPVLKRKWDKVSCSYSKYYENGLINREKIILLLRSGLTGTEISNKLNINKGYISTIKKKEGML